MDEALAKEKVTGRAGEKVGVVQEMRWQYSELLLSLAPKTLVGCT